MITRIYDDEQVPIVFEDVQFYEVAEMPIEGEKESPHPAAQGPSINHVVCIIRGCNAH